MRAVVSEERRVVAEIACLGRARTREDFVAEACGLRVACAQRGQATAKNQRVVVRAVGSRDGSSTILSETIESSRIDSDCMIRRVNGHEVVDTGSRSQLVEFERAGEGKRR